MKDNIDNIVFLDCIKEFNIKLKDGSSHKYMVALNLSTGLFYKILAIIGEMQKSNIEDTEKIQTINYVVSDVLKISSEWVMQNIEFETQLEILGLILNELTEILSKEFLQVPDIQVDREKPNAKNKEATNQYNKRKQIERLTNILKKFDNTYMMQEIALILTKTNNSYSEIMAMPILVFKDLVKTIILDELRSDTDYNLAYLRKRANEFQIELNKNNNETIKPSAPKIKGANIIDLLID